MPEYLSPGVYIEEQDTGPEPIEGVSTSVTGFVGVTQRGPLDGLPPALVTSFPDFQRQFGSYFNPSFAKAGYNLLPHAVAGFFVNGGSLLYIKRVAASGGNLPNTAAPGNIENNEATPQLLTRLASNANGGAATLSLQSLRGIQVGTTLILNQVKNGVTTTSAALTVASYDDGSNTVTLAAALAAGTNYEVAFTTVVVSGSGAFTPAPNTTNFVITAADPGAWGNHIQVQVRPSSRTQGQVQSLQDGSPGVHDTVVLNSAAGFYPGAIVEFNRGKTKIYGKVKAVSVTSIQMVTGFALSTTLDPDSGTVTTARSCEFDIVASWQSVTESLRGLSLDDTTPFFYGTAIQNGSTLLAVPSPMPSDDTTEDPSTQPLADNGLNLIMTGGDDGGDAPTPIDFAGSDGGPGNRTGIAALVDAERISIIAAPGITDQTTQQALIDQCETLRYRFAILDPAPTSSGGTPGMSDIQAQRDLFDTKYAAIYYPRMILLDPLTNTNIAVPPSGHMAGIYASVDDSRGVWKAPANVVINGITDLEIHLNKGDQDILNPEPNNINALRDFRHQGRGLRVYGARCITSLTEWKYINVRRLFIFLEASLDQGTQWAVFEPNDQKLWDRLTQAVSAFLTTVWREGGLVGAKVEEAFFVKCGRDTMSQDDIENGRLIMLVGVAPVFPAEFVIIRIGQFAGGSSVQEL
ncbi:MAG TPA: phage tail sheath C-terminal domain-containing protein [Bryobacteraceae bacterium]|nr:phage tail sheath C-terminal domain-containing protein [Bryobacteraceae bacterium]